MPAAMDRCVMHVMEQGHDKDSAYAICQAAMGEMPDDMMPDDEMKRRAGNEMVRRQYSNGPAFRKDMTVCTPFGSYVNGEQEGAMTKRRLAGIAERFAKYPRHVPVYALGDHQFDLDSRIPDGWVESLSVNARGELVAGVKLFGEAASLVINDRIRGASIGTVKGYATDGTEIGEVLQHLLLTNEPFDKSFNIAARKAGGDCVAYFSTALPQEPIVADEKDKEIARLKDELAAAKAQTPDEAVAAKLKETEGLLAEKIRECAEKDATIANLTEDVERFKANPQLEQAMDQLKRQDRQLRAEKIRRLVKEGVAAGQFNIAKVGEPSKTYDHRSDEMVLKWFKESIFADSLDRLEFALQTYEKKPLNRPFRTGTPASDDGELKLTQDDLTVIRKLGMDPEKVKAAMKAGNASEYASLTTKES